MERKFVIGDIHGGLRALLQIIAITKPSDQDQLIFLGDYVDGWSESAAVIEYLMGLSKNIQCRFIKGNHDEWCESWLAGSEPDADWLDHGGRATIESYRQLSEIQKQEHLEFFKSMAYYFVDQQKRLFIHAGFSSMHGPSAEHYQSNYTWDRTLWETALSIDHSIAKTSIFYPRRLVLFDEIFIGHTPTTNYGQDKPMQAANIWNVDTGAAFKGRLTIMNTESKLFYQSDPLYTLYPQETGRNG